MNLLKSVLIYFWLLIALLNLLISRKPRLSGEPEPGEPPTPIHTNAEKYYKIMVDSTSIAFALYMYLNRAQLCDQSRRRRVNNFKLKALNFLRHAVFLEKDSRISKTKLIQYALQLVENQSFHRCGFCFCSVLFDASKLDWI